MVGNGGACCGHGAVREEGERGKWSGERVRAGAGPLLERGRATWSLRQSLRATRRAALEPFGHGEFCPISEMAESTPDDTTDSGLLVIYNSQTVAIWFMV